MQSEDFVSVTHKSREPE